MKEKYQVPAGELEAQKGYMDKVARLDNRPGTYHIVTLGCQMNARDSETIAGMLEKMGMRAAPTREEVTTLFLALLELLKLGEMHVEQDEICGEILLLPGRREFTEEATDHA